MSILGGGARCSSLSFRKRAIQRIFPSDMKGDEDYTVKSQISSLSVYIEQNGAARLKASGFPEHTCLFSFQPTAYPANGVERS